jgi:Secretion system C-terminal sorting domain
MDLIKTRYLAIMLLLIVFTLPAAAQSWDDGMYHYGMGMMYWRGTDSLYTVSGKIIVDSSFSTTEYMNNMRPAYYYLDTVGNGSRNYQLFFGPYWYQPKNGTLKPVDGQSVVLKGIKFSAMTPPMLSVYIIDGNLWRDTAGVEPWSGGWIHRTDTDSTNVYCPTDSISYMHLSPNSMGMGMMGGGMSWPDSIFCVFEEMVPDSMPAIAIGKGLFGIHLDMFNPTGQTMMQYGSMNNGMMQMIQPVRMVFHIPQDSLNNRGLTMNQLSCQYMDNNGNWITATGITVNSSANTISISQSNIYSFYAIVPSTATAIENVNNSIPKSYELAQNYPNPFNPSTNIKYSLPTESKVILKIYDLLGKEVTELVNSVQAAGVHIVNFNATKLTSGIYFYTISAGNFRQVKKMILLK